MSDDTDPAGRWAGPTKELSPVRGEAMTMDTLLAIYRNIANGDDARGHFLTYFAKAIVQADLANQRLLLPVALGLIRKYDIEAQQRSRGILREEQYQ